MARNAFGGTAADVAEDIDGRRIPGAVGTVWDGISDGAQQVLDLLDADGAPIIQLVADQRGFIPTFLGPPDDRERLWVDFGVGRVCLISATVGDRLRAHQQAADPHNSRAYLEEHLPNYVAKAGDELVLAEGQTWLTVTVPTEADDTGDVVRLTAADGTARTRIRNSGAVYIDTVNTETPLSIGAPARAAEANIINVVNGPASGTSNLYVLQVKGDGTVNTKGAVHAANIGDARVFSGPNPPAHPQAGDVWVQYE
ncbi:hypothetical protein [Streptomyces ginkgonis]|uniref:hypothetical protein n=1 Tax=Streptomyces ginkgonis TaxID=1812259 RepID=UPI002176E778|nr:hypothetical protein [Streptomyces ginkgonis]